MKRTWLLEPDKDKIAAGDQYIYRVETNGKTTLSLIDVLPAQIGQLAPDGWITLRPIRNRSKKKKGLEAVCSYRIRGNVCMMFPKKKWCGGSKTSRVSLIHKLDKAFSDFVRLRDSVGISDSLWIRCITCNKFVPLKESDAGHFMSRNHLATRYNVMNVNAQCRKCNRFQSGRQFEHGQAIDKKYGPGTAEKLVMFSKMKQKFTEQGYLNMIQFYRGEVKRMKKEF
jgi:hypothetical protein